MDMILIPAGPFRMGAQLETIDLPAFLIARYAVTHAGYQAFVDASGHRAPKTWTREGFPPGLARHPVTYVSWEDALAYTQWAGVRLPSEAEWEKAARGVDGWVYPWGNEFVAENCNSSESKSEGTRAVDAHPHGASPYGVIDMAGNVWEWTSTLYEAGAEWRVLKGGAWDYKGVADARCASRVYFPPAFRNSAIGFRCCRDLD